MKEFEKIELLLKTKSYDELTKDEKVLIDEELSHESYEELHVSMTQLVGERLKVKNDVKRSLLAELKQKERRVFPMLRFQLPAYTHLVPLAVILYLLFFLPETEKVITKDRIVEVQVRDTVLINQTDTLWIERAVKVPTVVYVARDQSQPDEETAQELTANRSLSDQREVLDLVVRSLE